MRLLIDSHVLLWWLEDSPRLTRQVRNLLIDPSNEVFVSVATLWELALKAGKGKLQLPDDLPAHLLADGFDLLDVRVDHALGTRDLPALHGDPFDRMLVVQARLEGMVLVTVDSEIRRYDLPVFLA